MGTCWAYELQQSNPQLNVTVGRHVSIKQNSDILKEFLSRSYLEIMFELCSY